MNNYDIYKKYKEDVLPELQKKYGNVMAVPKIEKVVINSGIGSIKDKERIKMIEENLSMITGQKISPRPAKKSIASFKLREGSTIGYSVTLRGKRMYDFLNKLFFVAIPRQRDFQGLDWKSVDVSGNLTIGFKDGLVFPEMVGKDLKNMFGFSITIVTTANSREETIEFFKAMGLPFKKD